MATGPQLAAALPTGPQAGESLLTEAQLTPIVAEALARWATLTNVPALTAKDIPIRIADLPDGGPGQLPVIGYTDGTVLIDINAGGFGWFIDPTPADDAEFAAGSLVAPLGSPAAGRMDLLSVVMHEMGHVLGLQDVEGGDHDLMGETLTAGVRRVPGPAAPLDAPAADVGLPPAAGPTRAAGGVSPYPTNWLATAAVGPEPGLIATVIPTLAVTVEALPDARSLMPVTARLTPEPVEEEGWELFMGAAVDWFDDRPTLVADHSPPTRRNAVLRSELSDDEVYGLINSVPIDDPVLTPARLRTGHMPLLATGVEDESDGFWPAKKNLRPR